MRIGIVVSARTASKRLPGKALLDLMGLPTVALLMHRLSKPNLKIPIILATTNLKSDDQLVKIISDHGFQVFRGSSNDLVKRHINLADLFQLDYLIRVTGDCPFVDGEIVKHCLSQYCFTEDNFLGTTKGVFPRGLDCEIISVQILKKYWFQMTNFEKEHLTIKFYEDKFNKNIQYFQKPKNWPDTNKTFLLDTHEDYENIKKIASAVSHINASVEELLC